MNEKTFCFIICVNNTSYLNEAIYYLNRLYVPEGYAVDLITVSDASSMTAGYNEAMNSSDAKYKIYMHQDVFIIEPTFLYKILDIFKDPQIGLIGMVGCTELPENAIQWMGKRVGALISNNIHKTTYSVLSDKQAEVHTLDGLMLISQYDIRWRDDLFTGWDFYDASQSLEFQRNGYKIIVPQMSTPWVIHYDGILNLRNYWKYRKVFKTEYGTELNNIVLPSTNNINDTQSEAFAIVQEDREMNWQNNSRQLLEKFRKSVNEHIRNNDTASFISLLTNEEIIRTLSETPEYAFARLIFAAITMEMNDGITNTLITKSDSLINMISDIINPIRFYLWRIEFAKDPNAAKELILFIHSNSLSPQFLSLMIETTSVNPECIKSL